MITCLTQLVAFSLILLSFLTYLAYLEPEYV
jgi:hypothetical protein